MSESIKCSHSRNFLRAYSPAELTFLNYIHKHLFNKHNRIQIN